MLDCGLNPNTLGQITAVIYANPKVQSLILFGSRAKGTYRSGSDIDLAINVSMPMPFSELAALKVNLDALSLPYHIDLVILNDIENVALIEHINRVGIALEKP